MVNDLIFPILPREGKVPVTVDDRVKKINKSSETKALSEEERQEHDEERRVTEKVQEERHDREAKQQPQRQKKSPASKGEDAQEDSTPAEKDDKPDSQDKDSGGFKHLDIYI
ncbi:hypothetical protein [Alteromonas sp. 14N.309.X.WAT.G.H12]|uniref:hypothetical protein n=1 Tax=Alteromonas sp. 14N.309.X.WAT.G.H12 TaxID=3120824 RepID=UPI002FD6D1DC